MMKPIHPDYAALVKEVRRQLAISQNACGQCRPFAIKSGMPPSRPPDCSAGGKFWEGGWLHRTPLPGADSQEAGQLMR